MKAMDVVWYRLLSESTQLTVQWAVVLVVADGLETGRFHPVDPRF